MESSRSKNIGRNVVFGALLKIYHLLIPFVLRTIIIYVLGMEFAGLNSLFSSILSVLNLAELGVGTAMVYSMYKPIVDGDNATVNALMRLYKIYYRVIGLVILVAGLAILPFIDRLIYGDVPGNLNIYLLYFISLSSTVVSYWLFAYKNCLITAHQRSDVTSKVTIAVSTITYGTQIAFLFLTKNYYHFLIISVIMTAITNIVIGIVASKMYPQFHEGGTLPKEKRNDINKRIRDLFTAKIGAVVIDSVDTIVISAYLGFRSLALYQNYFYLFTAVYGFISMFLASSTASVGNSIITASKEKNFLDLRKFTLLMVWIGGICCCCFAGLYQPFMELWVGKENLLDYGIVLLLVGYFIIKVINAVLNLYKDAAGMWREDRFRPLVTAMSNLALNIILVNFIGLYGIILSTLISMLCVGMPWLYYNIFSVYFHCNPVKYILKTILYVGLVVVSVAVSVLCVNLIALDSLIITILVRLLICAIVPNVIFFVCLLKDKDFRALVSMADRFTKGKIKFLKKLY